jgi:hypoxanthine phosphoribosyltransferase
MAELQPDIRLLDTVFEPFISTETVQARIHALAPELNQAYASATDAQPVLLVPVLTGAFRFAAELLPLLTFPYRLGCVKVESYGEAKSRQTEPRLALPLSASVLAGVRQVLFIEDIVDTGHTLDFLHAYARGQGIPEVRCVSLLFKEACWRGQSPPDWQGFTIPDVFVVGFGLDYAEHGRHLPAIYKEAGK